MRYKQSSWDVVALQGQFAARIREFCSLSMTVWAWRCRDSTGGTHGGAVQKHRALFNHHCRYSENFIFPSAKKAFPLRLQSQLLAGEKSPDIKKDSGRLEWVAKIQLCARGQNGRPRLLGWGCEQWGQPSHWGAASHPCLRGCSHPCAWPCISWPRLKVPDLFQHAALLWLAQCDGLGLPARGAWHSVGFFMGFQRDKSNSWLL